MMTLNYSKRDLIQITPSDKKGKHYQNSRQHSRLVGPKTFSNSLTVLCLVAVIPWTVGCQAPLSMEFSRQEYWSGLLCPPPEDLLNPGIEIRFPTLQADSLPSEPPGKPMNTGVGSLSLL